MEDCQEENVGMEEPYQEKMAIHCGNAALLLCMMKAFSALGCGSMWKEGKQKQQW